MLSASAFTARAQDLGASFLYAPTTVSAPLKNLGSLVLPNGELKNGAKLVKPGLVKGAAAAQLDGANDFISTTYAPFISGQTLTFVGLAKRTDQASNDALFGGSGATPPFLWIAAAGQDVVWQPKHGAGGATTWAGAWPGNEQVVHYALVFDDAANQATLYVNGAPVSAKAQVNTYSGAGNLQLGAMLSSETFKGSVLPFAVFAGALSAAQILDFYRALPTPAARVVSEPLDDRMFVETYHADGTFTPWSGDEPDAAGIPQGIKNSDSGPGGHRDCSFTLTRDPRREWPDLSLVDDIVVRGRTAPLRRSIFEGQMDHFPSDLGDGMSIGINAVGNQCLLSEDETWRALYVALGFEGWEDPPLARREAIAAWPDSTGKIAVSSGDGLVWDPPSENLTAGEDAEVQYSSPAGLPVRKVGYRGSRNGDWSKFESPKLFTGEDEGLPAAAETISLTLDNVARVTTLEQARRYLMIRARVSSGHTPVAGVQQRYDRMAIYGDTDVPLRDIPGELPGVYGHDAIAHMLDTGSPDLNYTVSGDGTIVPNTSVVIPELAFPDPGTIADAIHKVNAYFLNFFGVWDRKEFHWHPWDPDRLTWKVRIQDGAHWAPAGEQATPRINGLVVSFSDYAGRPRTAGPPGSGCDFEDPLLAYLDPSNPYTRRGRRHWAHLPVEYPLAYASTAIQVGYVKLLEAQLPQRSATLILRPRGKGHVPQIIHPTLGPCPIWALRSGDYVELDGWPDAVPFRVIEKAHDGEGKSLTAQLDAPSPRMGAVVERVGARSKVAF